MTLDEILKEHSAWLDKAAKQPVFAKVTEKDVNFPQELRDRRAEEIAAAIEALSQRRDETTARYEAAVEGYKKELEALKSAPAPTTQPPTDPKPKPAPGPSRASSKKATK
ncbi:hypothetical protein [Mesorhizobium sp. LjNodule214]|uniref:hypothetical protein n=1 Tax=Mesorhizobium sp. LjNodule214 TaxID=3342252 RepID=UPI003ECF1394